jgi:hypothetical protein
MSLAAVVPCGSGKTVVFLAMIQDTIRQLGGGFGVVFAPTSVISTWKDQAAQYYPSLPFLLAKKTERKWGVKLTQKMDAFIENRDPFVLGLTYGQISRGCLAAIGEKYSPVVAVYDEFKLRYTETIKAQAVHRFIGTQCRVLIPIATPQQNKETDLPVTAFALGMPSVFGCPPGTSLAKLANEITSTATLGKRAHMRALFDYLRAHCFIAMDRPRSYARHEFVLSNHGDDGQHMGTLIQEAGTIAQTLPQLTQKISKLRRALSGTHTQLMRTLNDMRFRTMRDAQNELARLQDMADTLTKRRAFLDTLGRRQRTLTKSMTELFDYYVENEKEDGVPFIVFAHSLSIRDSAAEYFANQYGYRVAVLEGKTRPQMREFIFDGFQKNKFDVLLLGKCAYEGITLTAARDVLIIHEQQNPAIPLQTFGRVDRMDQTAACIRLFNLVVREGFSGKMFTLTLLIRRVSVKMIASLEDGDFDSFFTAASGMMSNNMASLRKFNFRTLVEMSKQSKVLDMFNDALYEDLHPDVTGIRKTEVEFVPAFHGE